MKRIRLIACLSFLSACATPAVGGDGVNWIRIRHFGESDKPIPTTWITTKRMGLVDIRELPQEAIVTLLEYETVSTNIRSFAAARPNLKVKASEFESSFGTFEVTESVDGKERLLFTVAWPDSCDFLTAIVGGQRSENLDVLREMTSRIGRLISCPGAAVN